MSGPCPLLFGWSPRGNPTPPSGGPIPIRQVTQFGARHHEDASLTGPRFRPSQACVLCGEPFVADRSSRVFCSRACRDENLRAAQRMYIASRSAVPA